MSKLSFRFYNDHEVRAIWSAEENKWFFSAIDVIAAINNEADYVKAGNYWRWLKKKLLSEGIQLVSDAHDFKLMAPDGKKRKADVLDAKGMEELAKHIPNGKAMAFLDWFTYSDSSVDGQSRKKAYSLFESNLLESIPVGTVDGLQQIHAYLFGGLYDFAGKIREKTISNGGFTFCLAQYLPQQLQIVERMPETTFDEIADKYVEMNVCHPFMEGNGRSTRIWLDMMLKARLGKCVDWSRINKNDYLAAMTESVADAVHIKALLRGALTDEISSRELFMKGIDYSYYYEQPE